MTMPRNPHNFWLLTAITFVLLPIAYVGTYLAVTKRVSFDEIGGRRWRTTLYSPAYSRNAECDFWLGRLFEPIHQIDRKIRHDFWQLDEYYGESGNPVSL